MEEFNVQKESLNVANVKCGGCAETIKKGLLGIGGAEDIQVDIADGRVEVSGMTLTRMASWTVPTWRSSTSCSFAFANN